VKPTPSPSCSPCSTTAGASRLLESMSLRTFPSLLFDMRYALISPGPSFGDGRPQMALTDSFPTTFAFVSPNGKLIPKTYEPCVFVNQFPAPSVGIQSLFGKAPPVSPLEHTLPRPANAPLHRGTMSHRVPVPPRRKPSRPTRPKSVFSTAAAASLLHSSDAKRTLETVTLGQVKTHAERPPRRKPQEDDAGDGVAIKDNLATFVPPSIVTNPRLADLKRRAAELLTLPPERVPHPTVPTPQTANPRLRDQPAGVSGLFARDIDTIQQSIEHRLAGLRRTHSGNLTGSEDADSDSSWEEDVAGSVENLPTDSMESIPTGDPPPQLLPVLLDSVPPPPSQRPSSVLPSPLKSADTLLLSKDRLVRQSTIRVGQGCSYRVALMTISCSTSRNVMSVTVIDPSTSRTHKREFAKNKILPCLSEEENAAVQVAHDTLEPADMWLEILKAVTPRVQVDILPDGSASVTLNVASD
jgi:hypothetical protein